jgi:hypothetical protein
MMKYLRRAAAPCGLRYDTIERVGLHSRLPRPLFECVEQGWLKERRSTSGASTGGHTLIYPLLGWDITDAGRQLL